MLAPKVATVRGIPIRLHLTLLLVVALLIVRWGWMGVPGALVLFGSVLLHELGHALTAQRFGLGISSVTLHLLGGMALMTEPPRTAKQEMAIAGAGPVVSLILGAGLAAAAWAAHADIAFGYAPRPVDLLAYGAALNLGIGLFNLLPALPMDGGRLFRAGLAARIGHARATRVAAWVSRAFAVVFVGVGLIFEQWAFALIGTLLFLLVAHETRLARYREKAMETEEPDLAEWAKSHGGPAETREEVVDKGGRRYVVVTKLVR